MARLLGPDMGSRVAFLPNGAPAAGKTWVIYSDAAGTQLADILTYNGTETPGAAHAGSAVTADGYGMPPLFWFPDGEPVGPDRLFASVNGGPLVPIDADYNRRIDEMGSARTALLAALGFMDDAVETTPRVIDGSYTAVSGRVNLSYLTAYRTQSISKLGASTRNPAVVGLTAARWGLYTVAANGDLTLVARTAQNTTTAYTATFTEYSAALDTAGGFPASYTLLAGQRYAFAQIVTFSTTAPMLRGYATNLPAATAARPPRLNGTLGGRTDLPTSITAGTIGNDGNTVYLFGLA